MKRVVVTGLLAAGTLLLGSTGCDSEPSLADRITPEEIRGTWESVEESYAGRTLQILKDGLVFQTGDGDRRRRHFQTVTGSGLCSSFCSFCGSVSFCIAATATPADANGSTADSLSSRLQFTGYRRRGYRSRTAERRSGNSLANARRDIQQLGGDPCHCGHLKFYFPVFSAKRI